MKYLLGVLLSVVAFSAHADIGDLYSPPGKVGRVSQDLGLMEIVGLTGLDPVSNKIVKVQIDIAQNSNGDDVSMWMQQLIQGATQYKLTMGFVVDPTSGGGNVFIETTDCLGKDFEFVPDPVNAPTVKSCLKVQFRTAYLK